MLKVCAKITPICRLTALLIPFTIWFWALVDGCVRYCQSMLRFRNTHTYCMVGLVTPLSDEKKDTKLNIAL